MKWLVTVRFVQGQQEERAALMSAEQAQVRALRAQGVIETIHVGADRSRVWLVMQGESQDHIQQALTSLPLYPYMALELTPLLDLSAGMGVGSVVTSRQPTAAVPGHGC